VVARSALARSTIASRALCWTGLDLIEKSPLLLRRVTL
jgi:hypothetical protein